MAARDGFVDSVLDLLAGWGGVSARRMFGGHGLYRDGRMFALVFGDVLYLKVNGRNRRDFEAAGMAPFTYARAGKPAIVMSYYEAPAELFDDADAMILWHARLSTRPWRRTRRGPRAAVARSVSRHAGALERSRSHSHVKRIVQRRGRGGRSRRFLTKCQPTERTTMARSIRKRSVIIAGHRSSVSLEPEFWEALKEIAAARSMSVNTLVSDVDRGRAGNLSSALRVHVLTTLRERLATSSPAPAPAPASNVAEPGAEPGPAT